MRSLLYFFAGITIAALTAGLVAVSIRIYDYAGANRIDAAIFRPAELYQNRIAVPIPLEKYGDDYIRNRLIAKFATEYLQVLPIEDELGMRAGMSGALRLMASPNVLSRWKAEILPELNDMASKRKMRRIDVSIWKITKPGDYFVVPFTATTWNEPNDLNAVPTRDASREMHIKVMFNKKVRETLHGVEFDAGRYLDRGNPPAVIFEFMVEEAIIR